MHQLAGRRAKAYLRDCLGYAGIAAATVPIGLALNAAGVGEHRGAVIAVSGVPPVVAAVVAARQESGRGSTWGKRREALAVTGTDGAAVPFDRALWRNAVKITVPWQLGHVVAIGAAYGGYEDGDPLTIGATAVLYALGAAMAVTLLRGEGRGLHDRAARTVVRSDR